MAYFHIFQLFILWLWVHRFKVIEYIIFTVFQYHPIYTILMATKNVFNRQFLSTRIFVFLWRIIFILVRYLSCHDKFRISGLSVLLLYFYLIVLTVLIRFLYFSDNFIKWNRIKLIQYYFSYQQQNLSWIFELFFPEKSFYFMIYAII